MINWILLKLIKFEKPQIEILHLEAKDLKTKYVQDLVAVFLLVKLVGPRKTNRKKERKSRYGVEGLRQSLS